MYSALLSHFSHVWFCVTPWTVSCQTSLYMGFSRQEYQMGCHFCLQGIFPIQGSTYTYVHFFFFFSRFSSHLSHHGALNRLPYVIHSVLISHLLYTYCIYVNSNLPTHHTLLPPLPCFITVSFFSISMTIFLLKISSSV